MSSALLLLLILLAVAASAAASTVIYSKTDGGDHTALFLETYVLVLFIGIMGIGIIANMWGNAGRLWPRVLA